MKPLRIVHVVSSLHVGGMEHFVVRIAARQKQAGHCVSVLALQSGGPLRREAMERGLNVVELGGKSRALRVLRGMAFLARKRPDIVHGHNPSSLQYAILSKRCSQAKFVLTCHGRGKADTREPTAAEWRQTDAIAAVSEAVAGDMRRSVPPERLTVIRNGIEAPPQGRSRASIRTELGLNGSFMGIIVARIDHLKGHDTLLHACAQLRHEGIPLTLLIVGDGTERENRMRLSKELGFSPEQVRFLGFRSDVSALLAASDFFVLPSLTEGLPLSILEAMSHGLPIVATNVGGIPELVRHESDGLLVPPQDPDALAKAIGRLAGSHQLCSEMGSNGRQRVREEFSFEAMLRNYETLYLSLLQ